MKTDNFLIAEYMGFKIKANVIRAVPDNIEIYNGLGYSATGFLKFHTSFNWLMPVIKEILNDLKNSDQYSKTYDYWENQFRTKFWDIDALYDAIIKFIRWHNKYE